MFASVVRRTPRFALHFGQHRVVVRRRPFAAVISPSVVRCRRARGRLSRSASMAEDLEALIALGGGNGADPADGAAREEDGDDQAAELQELVALQRMGDARPRKFQRQSWELMSHARSQRALATAKAQAAASSQRADQATADLAVVARHAPAIAKAAGIQVALRENNSGRNKKARALRLCLRRGV